jgi:hypothetical protein
LKKKTDNTELHEEQRPIPFDQVIRKLVNTPPIHNKDIKKQKRKKKAKLEIPFIMATTLTS